MRSMSMKVCFYRGGWMTCMLQLEDGTSDNLLPTMITSDGWYSWMMCDHLEKCINISTIIVVSLYWK